MDSSGKERAESVFLPASSGGGRKRLKEKERNVNFLLIFYEGLV